MWPSSQGIGGCLDKQKTIVIAGGGERRNTGCEAVRNGHLKADTLNAEF